MATPDAQRLLGRLVACPSVAGHDNIDLIAEIADRLQSAGAAVRIHDSDRPGAQMLHAVLGPQDAPHGVLLAAHGDVVPVDGQRWTSDPFALRIDDGRMYGRGAADMKGFIAATLAAVAKAPVSSLRAPLHVAISHDEELGCVGVPRLLDALAETGAVAAPLAGVVVGEPTQLRVVDRHKGKVSFEITLRGRAAHSATPSHGVNAVRAAAHLIVALEQLEAELHDECSDPGFEVPHATVGIGPIAGGVALNIVPERCTLKVETRMLPDQAPEEVAERVEAVAQRVARTMAGTAPDAGIDVARIAGYPPLRPAAGQATFAARVAAITGEPAGGAVDFGTEAGVYQARLGVPVVVCGPGAMAQGHTADEYLEVTQLGGAEALVAGIIAELSRSAADA